MEDFTSCLMSGSVTTPNKRSRGDGTETSATFVNTPRKRPILRGDHVKVSFVLTNTPALEIQSLEKVYVDKEGQRRTHALKGVSFSISPGEIFGLLGPNGAGKTTLISIVTTLETKTRGEVRIFGINPETEPLKAKQMMGVVPQEIVAQGYFNLEEILAFQSGYYGLWRNKERIEELLQDLDLWEHRKKLVKQLSGGMKRRLMIAKALVHRPRLLVLDEPTAGVDVELRQKLWEYTKKLQNEGVTVLLTTHYLAEAEELCSRVGILNRGDLPYIGSTRSIIQSLTVRNIEITLRKSVSLRSSPDIQVLSHNDQGIQIRCPHEIGFGDVIAKLQIPVDSILDVKTREGTLEEAFINLLSQNKTSSKAEIQV